MSDERRTTEQLHDYLEQPERDHGSLDPALKEVADALQHAASASEPRPGFINELAQQLQQKEQTMSDRNTQPTRPRFRRLLAGALALAGLLLIVVVGSNLMMQPEVEPAALDLETREPAVVAQATGGEFAGTEFRIQQELSAQPQELPLYEAQLQQLPATPQDARELAASLGIPEPHVYHNPNQPSQWIVMGDDGSNISFTPTQRERAGLYYQAPPADPDYNAEPLSVEEATAVAEAFLENATLLPPDYQVSERPQAIATGTRQLRFTPLLDGRPVVGREATIDVGVGPDGVVHSARVTPVRYMPLEEVRTAGSEQDALQELLEGPDTYTYSFDAASGGPGFQIFRPQGARPQVGQQVTYTGTVNVLVGVESDTVRAIFHPLQTTTPYELSGPLVEELRDVPYGSPVQISGIPGEIPESGRPPLEVLSWEPAPEVQLSPTCRSGTASRTAEESLLLETDSGETYRIPDAPAALRDGQRIEVCAVSFDEEPVSWLSITAPPASQINAGSSGGGGVSAAVEGVEAVEVTRVITEETAGSGQSESQPSESSSDVDVARPAQVEGTLEDLELGQTTTITGVVEGVIREGSDGQQLQVGIRAERGDEPLEVTYDYVPLQGNDDLLQEIAQHYRLHVTVSGVVVPADDSRMGDRAIDVQSYSRPFPDEQLQTFLGHFEEDTVEDREIVLFVDDDTGDRYVVARDRFPFDPEQKVAVAGVVHPIWQIGDLPVLRTHQQRTGPDVDAMESAADLPPVERSVPVARQGGGPQLQGPLVVERVRLGYSLDVGPGARGESNRSETLTPVWIFEGHTANGSQTFTIEIEVGE
ncbi:MAG: hypothetical protein ACOC9X_03620 [bacterium]